MKSEQVSINEIIQDLGMVRKNDMDNIEKNLQYELAIPSVIHTFSLVTEFISMWFQQRFPTNYFKHVHIAGKHIFEEYRTFRIEDLVTKETPLLAIAPKINLAYDRDTLDTNQFGVDYLVRTGRVSQSYIRDFEKQLFVGGRMEQLDLEYDLRIRVETRAQQVDLYKRLSMAFPMGHTTLETVYLDYHLPYNMMMQMAKDAGFKINEDRVLEDPISFVNYLNKHSRLPIVYKYRTINGRLEFFIRFHDIDLLIDLTDMPNYDDGDNRNKRNKYYHIDIRIGVKAPSPKFFIYYSSNRYELIDFDYWKVDEIKQNDNLLPIHLFQLGIVPLINEKGWNQHTNTEYLYDEDEPKDVINIEPILKTGDLQFVIEYAKKSGLSPDQFIEVYAYNAKQHRIPNEIDWDTFELKLKPNSPILGLNTALYFYIDTEYTNTVQNMLNRLDRTERLGVYNIDKNLKK